MKRPFWVRWRLAWLYHRANNLAIFLLAAKAYLEETPEDDRWHSVHRMYRSDLARYWRYRDTIARLEGKPSPARH